VGTVVGKGSKLRTFYVDSSTLPLLAEYLASRSDDNEALFLSERQQRISPRAVQYTLTSWCKKLGLPHLHPHRLRHSFASRLANAHIDHLQLKELMGHSDFNTTLGYFRILEQRTAQGYHAAMELYRQAP
jgi:site-specific recombinase XerC